MPHQCVRCNTFHEDGAEEILKGCECGGKLFFYIKKEKLEAAKRELNQLKLDPEQKEQIETDVFDIIGDRRDPEVPVVLDLESIRILKPGKYDIDLVHIFRGEPLVFKLEEGKYIIDITESFKNFGKKKKKR